MADGGFYVSNPPFFGGKRLRTELGDKYVDDLFRVYEGRVAAESDLVVYWFEKTRADLEAGGVKRAGLLGTQGIRGGANRQVLERIGESAHVFMAWSDLPWLLDGAAVRISIVGFEDPDSGEETLPILDGNAVPAIHPDLTSGTNTTGANVLPENAGICFMGTTKVGAFDIEPEIARKMLAAPINPNGRPNSDVVRPWVNARILRGVHGECSSSSLERRWLRQWRPCMRCRLNMCALMCDHFGKRTSEMFIGEVVEPWRAEARSSRRISFVVAVHHYVSCSKHRLFAWLTKESFPDSATFAFARDDDYSWHVRIRVCMRFGR